MALSKRRRGAFGDGHLRRWPLTSSLVLAHKPSPPRTAPFESPLGSAQKYTDRPAPPLGPVSVHDLRFAGEPAEHKLSRIVAELAILRADALVISDPHAVAWTFNIRGSDISHNPVALAFTT